MKKPINTISYDLSLETDGIYYDVYYHNILGNTHYTINETIVEDDGCCMSHEEIENKYFATVEHATTFCKNENSKNGLPRWYRVIEAEFDEQNKAYSALDADQPVKSKLNDDDADYNTKWY